MSEAPAPEKRPRRVHVQRAGKRHGRMRRWVVRPLLWGLLTFVVLLTVVYFLLQSQFAHRRAAAYTVARLSEFLQRDVRVGSVDYDFTPLAFELRDVVVPGPRPDDPAVARVPRVRATFSWRDLRQRVLRLEEIEVTGPQIYIQLNPDGTTNLPELRARRRTGQARFETQIGHIVVERGTLQLNERRLPFELDAREVWGRLEGSRADGKIRLDGHVTAQEVVTTLPDANPYPMTLSAKGSFTPGRIGIENARFSSPEVQGQVAGAFTWQGRGRRQLALTARANGSARLASRLGYVKQPIDGPFQFQGRFDMENRDWRWSGDLTSPRFQFENRVIADLAAGLVGTREDLVVAVEQARYANGTLKGTVTVDLGPRDPGETGRAIEVDMDFARLGVQPLLRDQFAEEGVPGLLAAVTGRLTGNLAYRFRSDAILAGSGRTTFRAESVQGAVPGGTLPVSAGNLALTIDRGVVRGRGLRLNAPRQVVDVPSLTYDMNRGNARVEYRVASEDVGRLEVLFPTPRGEERAFWLPTAGRGTARGTLDLFRGGFSTDLALDLRDVATPDFSAETVTGSLTVRPEAVEDLRLEARRGSGLLRLAGRIPLEGSGRRPQPLTVNVQTEDWSAPEIAAFLMPEDFPDLGAISGTLSGNVDLTGAPEALRGQARFLGSNIRIGEDFRAEDVQGSLTLRPDAIDDLQVTARQGASTLALSGRIPLGDEGRPAAGALDLAVRAEGWPTAGVVPFLAIAEIPDPGEVAGTVSGTLVLRGPDEALAGRADVRFDRFAWQGNPVGEVQAAVDFQPGGIIIERGLVRTPAGEVLVQGSLTRPPGGEIQGLDLTLDAPALALNAEPLRRYVGDQITGELSVAASVGGTLERPDAMVVVRGRNLTLSGRPLGTPGQEAEALVTWNGEALRATGDLLGLASFEGGGRLDRQGADLAFDLRSDALGTLARLAAPQMPELAGSLTGTLGYAADFRGGEVEHRGVLRLADLRVQYQGRTITNLEPIVIAASPERVEIRSLYLGEPGTPAELFLTGDVGLGESNPLDLRYQGTLPLVWAELAVPDLDVEGQVELIGTARGTLADPQLNGLGQLRQARLILPDFPQAIEDIQGAVFLTRDSLVLDGVTARIGGGQLQASGDIALPDPGQSLAYNLNLSAKDISLRYPEGWLVRGGAVVSLSPLNGGQQIRGSVTLDRAFYVEDVDLGLLDLVQGLFQRQRLEVPPTEGFLATTQLNLTIEGQNALQVRNNVANVRGDVDLTVRGTLASPVVFGVVEVEPGGTLVYADNEYRIERGLLTFNDPYRINPLIDLVARTEVRNFDITLSLAGTLERLDFGLSSNSDLADLEILSLLATGQEVLPGGTGLPPQPGQVQGEPGVTQGAVDFLYGQAASAISERVNTLFGFDRLRINPTSETGQGISGVSVTVGKRLSRDVFVTYTNLPGTDEQYVAQVEWQLSDNVTLVLTNTGRDYYAVDVQWEKRF